MMWASFGRAPPSSSAASASTSMPSVLERDRQDLGAELAQREQRAVVGRRLDDHDVARLDELVEQEGVGLHRPVRGDEPVRLDVVLLRQPLEQARVAGRGSVGAHAARIALEGAVGGGAQLVDRDDVERGCAARQRDVGELGHRMRHDTYGFESRVAPR